MVPTVHKYIIKVDPNLSLDKSLYFLKRVQEILALSVRWKGHDFIYVGPRDFNNPDSTPETQLYDIIVVLLSRDIKHKLLEMTNPNLLDQLDKDGHGKSIDFKRTEFSYTFFTKPRLIIIDEINWTDIYKKLGISRTDYEQYVLFHEFGHAIGKSHKPIPTDINKPYPIMYQATLGLPDVTRFRPYPNESDYSE